MPRERASRWSIPRRSRWMTSRSTPHRVLGSCFLAPRSGSAGDRDRRRASAADTKLAKPLTRTCPKPLTTTCPSTVSGEGRVAGLAQVNGEAPGGSGGRAVGCVVAAVVPEVPGGEAEEERSAVVVRVVADGAVGRVFPERGGSVESREAATDRGLAGAAVAVAGEQGDCLPGRLRLAFVVPGGSEASQLGRDGERAAPGSGEDGAVAGEPAEVGAADVVRAAREDGDDDQRGELAVRGLVGQRRGAGDGGVELAGSGLAEAVLEDAVEASRLVSTPARWRASSAARMRT